MNNDYIVKNFNEKEEEENSRTKEIVINKSLYNNELIITAIDNLKENEDYLRFKEFVLDESIRTVEKRITMNMKELVRDKDGTVSRQIVQDQGMLVAFRKFADLEELGQIYKVENDRLLEIQKLKNLIKNIFQQQLIY